MWKLLILVSFEQYPSELSSARISENYICAAGIALKSAAGALNNDTRLCCDVSP